MKAAHLFLVILLIFLTSCTSNDTISPTAIHEITSPAGAGSGQQNLAVGPDGKTYLTWIETNDAGSSLLKFSTGMGDGWSEPRTIVQSDELLVNWADFPSLLPLENGVLAVHWMSLVPDSEGYNVNVAVSRDGGQTWTKPVVPHRDGTPTEHGFVSMVRAPDGNIGTIWLDSRKLQADSDEVSMMYTSINLDGQLGAESQLDGRVCECCQPSAASVPGGILAAYRDRTENEIRDIAVVRFDGKQWSEPKIVFEDAWEIYACPINGPAIAAEGRNVAVAWFTAANDKPKVQLAFSEDGGDTFGQPVQIDDGNPMGRVDVVTLPSGGAIVSWLEKAEKSADVRVRAIQPDGTRQPSIVVGATSVGTTSGFPRMERAADTVVFAWTDTGQDKVRTSVLDLKN